MDVNKKEGILEARAAIKATESIASLTYYTTQLLESICDTMAEHKKEANFMMMSHSNIVSLST